ncbi:helix-turn-helix domain-containing protein [Flavobacterium sp. NST-5]|uniref:Helix-turn-helix domain-containing protein n=1 Tax=Flavobacterium ichthyis TaxID=2698827 RepID=A0ABW9Z6A8_9FLAO|nr:helix-turn-helix transcriptional regulator [Flavobacterium ichthyis]NBL64373.1 helix-turn-helix domain-containing protein [Flavobacterium ichthyis]
MKISGKNIGEMLKEAREQKCLTQEQLAQKVGKKRSYISKIEGENGNNIKVQTLIEVVEKGLGGKIEINF